MSLFTLSKSPLKGVKPGCAFSVFNHVVRLSSQNFDDGEVGEFRQLQVKSVKTTVRKQERRFRLSDLVRVEQKRANKIDPDNVDWKSIWPGPRTFDPNAIPIPVRQGRLKPTQKAFAKYANPELMKIPAFFHLTPPAIKAHCEELKKFCTPFPKELDSKEKCEKYFPMTVETNDYLHSAPTIRDPLARIVTVKIKLKDIPLDEHARDKFLRLVADRYDEKSDTLTITTDRCPLRKQNYDYAQYLLTALFFESWKVEEWESEKSLADMEKYEWERHVSAKALASILKWSPEKLGQFIFHDPLPEENLKPEHKAYGAAVKKVVEGETADGLLEYKRAALEILLPKVKSQMKQT